MAMTRSEPLYPSHPYSEDVPVSTASPSLVRVDELRRMAMEFAVAARRDQESLLTTAQDIYDFLSKSGKARD